MQPMNYTIQTGNPGESFQQGMQQTAGMMATVADYQKAQAMATAAQQKAEHDAYKRQRFMQVSQNPTSKDVQGLLLEFPELHEGVGKVREFMSADELRNTHALASSVLSALDSNNQDAAIKLVDQQYEAAKSSGNQDAMQKMSTLRDSVLSGGAQLGLRMMLMGTMSPKEWSDYKDKMDKNKRDNELQPALVEKGKADASEAQSKATIAAAKAKFAESDAALDLQKKGWDITKIQEDIKINKLNSQIAAMNASTSRMNAGTAAAEKNIKLQELIDKRNTAVREKAAEAANELSTIDSSRSLIGEILGDEDTLRAASGVSGFRGYIPGTKSRSMAGKLEQLSNSLAATKLSLLKGATSDKDIKFLQTIDSNLDRFQNEDALVKEVKRIDKGLLDLRQRQADKYGVPNKAPIMAHETPSGKDIDALLKKYGQ